MESAMDLRPTEYADLIKDAERLLVAFNKSNQTARKKFPKG
jgi:hypothetical protein